MCCQAPVSARWLYCEEVVSRAGVKECMIICCDIDIVVIIAAVAGYNGRIVII